MENIAQIEELLLQGQFWANKALLIVQIEVWLIIWR